MPQARPLRSRSLRPMLSLLLPLALGACDPQPKAEPKEEVVAAAATPATPATPAAPAAPAVTKNACTDAALTLADDEVIATVAGEPMRASDLGDQLRNAERDALRTYCQGISQSRQQALDQAIDQRVLEAAAKEAGQDVETFLKSKVEAAAKTPTDEEALAFYESHKNPTAPPFEAVKDQVIAAMVDEQTGKALEEVVRGLRAAASIEVTLPDVKPPPLDLTSGPEHPSMGDQNGVVEVVEFSDFECPYCSRAADTMRGLKERYPEKVRFTFRHFPLSFHPAARPAAEHAQCAHEQGLFWPYHDLLFANQRELGAEKLAEYAAQAGVDKTKFDDCLRSGRAGAHVTADQAKGQEVGVGGTPSFYINGSAYAGNPTVDGIAAAIDAELAAAG